MPVLLPEPLGAQVDELLGQDMFVEAVLVRRWTGPGLQVVAIAVEHRWGG